jgi:hypothetical protein
MKQRIRDPAAWTFSRTFYRALANGRSVRKAYDQGRAALAFRGMSEEDLPELIPCGVDPASIGLTDHGESLRSVDDPYDHGLPQNFHVTSSSTLEPTHPKKRSESAGEVSVPASHQVPIFEGEAIAELEREKPLSSADAIPPTGPVIHSISIKLVRIPAGEFLMGSPDADPDADDDEKPQHLVRITRPFLMGPWPVTQSQYQRVMDETPSCFKDQPENPVETVSWYDAVRFCNRLSEMEKLKPFYRIEGKITPLASGNMPGTGRILVRKLSRLVRNAPTHSACTTCTAMSGSGAGMGGIRIIINSSRCTSLSSTRSALRWPRLGWSAAAAGTSARAAFGRQSASGASQTTSSSAWASAWPAGRLSEVRIQNYLTAFGGFPFSLASPIAPTSR